MRISLIAAVAKNRVIGRRGKLPWRIPADMKHFKSTTMGKPIIMGRKTYESIGVALPGRTNIVVTNNPTIEANDIKKAKSVHEALKMAREEGGSEVIVIGGGQIYDATLPIADRIYLTEVHAEFEGDAWFPHIDKDVWKEVSREDHKGQGKTPGYSFVILDRK